MSRQYRIVTQDDGRFLPEVRHKWFPWVWSPVNKDGWEVERCDYGGEKTNAAAVENCRTHHNKSIHVPLVRYIGFDMHE